MIELSGAIDLHVHSAPDVYPRSLTDFELALAAEAAGMRALLLKSHHTLTADRAALVSPRVGIDVFGGLTLNWTVGGLNPVAVETAIRFGAREIWMPTIHAKHCLEVARVEMFREEVGKGHEGITAIDPDGTPHPRLLAILEMMRDADVILGTGHLAPTESLHLLRRARGLGLRRLLVTHPQMSFTRFSEEQMVEAVRLGAMLELDALSCWPHWPDSVSAAEAAAVIRNVGPGHCVLGSDGGQRNNPAPPRMLRDFAAALHREGVARSDLRTMLCDNPARLLY